MAIYLNKNYWLKSHAGTGKNLNIYGNEQVSASRNVCLWTQDRSAYAQQWVVNSFSGIYKIITALNDSYALGRDTTDNNCEMMLESNNDSKTSVAFVSVDADKNVYKIKLNISGTTLYLTAASNTDNANVYWAANTGTNAQHWKFVEVTEIETSDEYGYPTDSRTMSRGYSSSHPAIDVTGTTGVTPIYAFADGIISWKQTYNENWHPDDDDETHNGSMQISMGNAVAINHYNPDPSLVSGEYARTIYMHMSAPCSLSEGSTVNKGDIIGYIGNTGRSTGPHLHFCLSVGDLALMEPGETGWIQISNLPNKDAVETYLPDYHL
ncbi:MAG: peptidoglycan DD-metalloendopeptidase family protein [Clostridia bacterium]|nr:peptidoglycan DD-metalloendopeptidase family protein [Clostridia bacterium]